VSLENIEKRIAKRRRKLKVGFKNPLGPNLGPIRRNGSIQKAIILHCTVQLTCIRRRNAAANSHSRTV